MTERPNRSDAYQYRIVECIVPGELLESYTNQQSIGFALDPFKYEEELDLLKEQLKEEFWKMVEQVGTPRQKEVLYMVASGMTQMEIANKLGVNQSSITKSINGNLDYKHGKKVYGGMFKKLKKAAEQNEKIQQILERMAELNDEKL